jgi:hypothetical protein
MRPSAHTPTRQRSLLPLILGKPVHVCTAVNRKPEIIAGAKPNSISCACHQYIPFSGASLTSPCRVNSQSSIANVPNMLPPKKNGLNPSNSNGMTLLVGLGSEICIIVSPLKQRPHYPADQLPPDLTTYRSRNTFHKRLTNTLPIITFGSWRWRFI